MHLKALKVFCDVVSHRSFSRAADQNDISQSGASQMVHQLEEHLGVKLIDRSKRPFVLTPEGQVYYDGCRSMIAQYFALEDRLRAMAEEVAGRVRVASIYSVGLHQVDHCLKQFMQQHPQANVRLEYLHPRDVYAAIERDTADLGLVSYPKTSRTLETIPWRDEPMALVCAPQHRLAGRPQAALAELDGEAFVGFTPDLTIRREIDRVLAAQRVAVNVVMEFDNIETIKRAIEINAGVAILPTPTVVREVESGDLVCVPLDGQPLVRPLGIIFRHGRELSASALRFIDLLKQTAAGGVAPPADSINGHDARAGQAGAARPSQDASRRRATRRRIPSAK